MTTIQTQTVTLTRGNLSAKITTERGYFSVTGEVRDRNGRIVGGGCIHSEILATWPELAPLVALHLSDCETGEPMHAESNGFYQLAGAVEGGLGERYHAGNGFGPVKSFGDCAQSFADRCRIDLPRAHLIIGEVREAEKPREKWAELCNGLRAEWAEQAKAGRELLAALIDQHSGEPGPAQPFSGLIDSLGLALTATEIPTRPDGGCEGMDKGASHWHCVIGRKGSSLYDFVCYYSRGSAYREWAKSARELSEHDRKQLGAVPGVRVGQAVTMARRTIWLDEVLAKHTRAIPPTLGELLECLADDLRGIDSVTFEEWCSELGMDTDSRKAEATFRTLEGLSKGLRRLLGREGVARLTGD